MKHKTCNTIFKILFVFLVILTITSCANVENIQSCTIGEPYGFWSGLWHGLISPISFIASIFSNDIAMYGVNNTGSWYDLGFVLGSGILLGGSSTVASK